MSKRPNVIVILTDQQRGDAIGYENPVVETPYLDDLAYRGARFTNAYSAVPSCSPARAAMMTGMDQWNHGNLGSRGGGMRGGLEFPATVAGELSRAGYHTQGVGKMDHEPRRKLYGFHNMTIDATTRGYTTDYQEWLAKETQGKFMDVDHALDWNSSWMARPSHLPEHLHPTYWTATQAIEFVRKRDPSMPFFMWFSFSRPHPPHDPPQLYYDMYCNKPNIPLPAVGDWAAEFDRPMTSVTGARGRVSDELALRARAAYYANITFIDHQIGRFLYEFNKVDPAAARNTLYLFTSDHGDMLGDHHHWRKTHPYQGSVRVPFFVKYPDTWDLPRGRVFDQPIEMRDIMPTALDAAGAPIPESVDGSSLLRLARDESASWRPFVQGEYQLGNRFDMQYMVDGNEKFIWYSRTGEQQFFDLAADPLECVDLSGDARHRPRLDHWRRELARINERRGDARGKDGRLVEQPNGVPHVTENYLKWQKRAEDAE